MSSPKSISTDNVWILIITVSWILDITNGISLMVSGGVMESVIFEHRDKSLTVYIDYAHAPFNNLLRGCTNRTSSTRISQERKTATLTLRSHTSRTFRRHKYATPFRCIGSGQQSREPPRHESNCKSEEFDNV